MFGNNVVFDRDELDMIAAFAGCSLDEKPGSNWVQEEGGLPEYICRIARAVKKTGKTTSQAIAIAVSRVKKWASGVGVDKDTQAKAAKAVAEWEKLKGKARAKGSTRGSKLVKASNTDDAFICLANADYNTDIVRSAWDVRQREARKAWRAKNPTGGYDEYPDYGYVRELWTNFVIVASGYGDGRKMFKVPYAVDDKLNVTFSDPAEVKTQYVVVANEDLTGSEITDKQIQEMMTLSARGSQAALDKVLRLSHRK